MSDSGAGSSEGAAPHDRRRRLFFALWPDDEMRRRLQERIDRHLILSNGRAEPIGNLHVTLVFIGDVEAGRVTAVERAVAGIPGAAFELSLERVGYWGRPRILWLGPREVPPPLYALVGHLRAAVGACGFAAETRPYLPHMTLARKVSRPPRVDAIEPVRWSVSSYSLMESVPAAGRSAYLVLNSWPLSSESR